MLHALRTRTRILSAGVAAAFVALWFASFASACMAATGPACNMPDSECARNEVSLVAEPCEQAGAPCELPSLNAPVAGKLHFSFAQFAPGPVSLSFAAPSIRSLPPNDWRVTRSTNTPLYLTYLALLH